MKIVVMGVSGCGKSAVGEALAKKLGAKFADADDLHSDVNIAKMAAGVPLTDTDRWPWLDKAGEALQSAENVVLACSALRRIYRDRLRASAPDALFVHLHGLTEILANRLNARTNHFMPPSMLASQLDTLEPLESDENGKQFNIEKPLLDLVEEIYEWLTISCGN